MKRFIGLGLALALFAPVAVGNAAAATKKKSKKAPQVAGFVQSATVFRGTLKNTDRIGEGNLGYRDNTQAFFARIANNGNK